MNSIALIGASFETGNLGVGALADSSVKCILHRWPQAEIVFLGVGREPCVLNKSVSGCKLRIRTWPVRFSPKVFVANHFFLFSCGV